MNSLYLFRRFFLVIVLFFSLQFYAVAQFRDANIEWKALAMNTAKTIDGYYQSLPAGYADNTSFYPLIVYLHGDESVEDGHTAILRNGIPKLISGSAFPEQFQVRGMLHSFIVIAPHYTTKSLSPEELNEAINFSVKKFRVNTSRIYLTGMSRGGAYTWNYAGTNTANATRLAAIVPVANAVAPNRDKAAIIGNAELPVWATHNDGDYLVPASNTSTYVDWVNEQKPQPRAELTLFRSNEHEGWTQTYDPGAKFKGRNIYEWLLQHTSSSQIPLPVKLTSYKAYVSGASQITIEWATADEAAGSFAVERSASQNNFTQIARLDADPQRERYTCIDENPLPGDNYYRLSQTEPDRQITYFRILKVVQNRNEKPALTLHPNSVTNQAFLQLSTSERGPVTFLLFTAGGRLLQQWTIQKEAGNWQETLSFAHLVPGSYILQATGQLHQQAVPFLKK